jgi:hypothetical protein
MMSTYGSSISNSPDIDDEYISEFSAEMGNVKEMLRVTKLEDKMHLGYLQLAGISTIGLESSVQVY